MSDCIKGGRLVYQKPTNKTLRIVIEFEGEEKQWTYPLALNGRRVNSVYLDGVRYAPTKAKDWDDIEAE